MTQKLIRSALPEMADHHVNHPEEHKDDSVIVGVIIQAYTQDAYEDDSLHPLNATKAKILNDSCQEIGMGKYQVRLNPGYKVSFPRA